jgi:hypothetical protein
MEAVEALPSVPVTAPECEHLIWLQMHIALRRSAQPIVDPRAPGNCVPVPSARYKSWQSDFFLFYSRAQTKANTSPAGRLA